MGNDVTAFLRKLRKDGYTVEKSGSNHYRISWKGQLVTVCSCTPGSWNRGLKNVQADIRRHQRQLEGK